MEKMNMQTPNIADRNFATLAKMFPNAITETIDENGEVVRAIDADVLRQEISCSVVEGKDERYQFTWPDKKQTILSVNKQSNLTLRPSIDDSVNFDDTENVYIEGDNFEVLKVLQETYLGKIKVIYIDPPYNTGKDFVYHDDFKMDSDVYEQASSYTDELGNRLVVNAESNGRFHSDWLNMMYGRLKLSRNLLTEDGMIFISIDDNEIENLRKICDEIFGHNNFVAQFIWKKKQGGGNDSSHVVAEHEYILCFSKDISNLSLGLDKKYKLDDALYPNKDEKGEYGLITLDKASIQFSQSLVYEIEGPDGQKYLPRVVNGKQSCWRWSQAKVKAEYNDLVFKNGKVYTKYYRPEGVTPRSLLIDSIYGRTESGNDDIKALFSPSPFSYPKPVSLIKHFISIGANADDIILDFFSGSSTTAQAVMELNAEENKNLRFIMVQLPETTYTIKDGKKVPNNNAKEAFAQGFDNICKIGEERIRRAGIKIKADRSDDNVDVGFRVFKLDSTNMKDVYYNPSEVQQTLFDIYADNIKEDRTPDDLLFQVMLDLGVLLSSKIEKKEIDGKKVFNVADGFLIACFDSNVTEETVKAVAEQKPYYAVFRDSSMANDSVATNFDQIFDAISPETVRKVL